MVVTTVVICLPLPETIKKWQLEAFEAIMEAYECKLSDYQRALEQAKEQDIEIRGNNPLYNRVIEKVELKKWCIQMLQRSSNNFLPWSEAMQHPTPPADLNDAVQVEHAMPWFYNDWAAAHRPFLQLLEGAIDWELMTYEFLPYYYYYWTARRQWTKLSQIQDAADPQFQAFLQAGAARVFVPVKRGQESAVAWYLATQQIKTGKDLDKLPEGYEFIKTEMENPDLDVPVTAVGSTWETVVPTSLIVMQAASGAVAGIGLPCNCPKEQADGTDATILTQSKQQTPCPPCNCAEDGTVVEVVAQEKEG